MIQAVFEADLDQETLHRGLAEAFDVPREHVMLTIDPDDIPSDTSPATVRCLREDLWSGFPLKLTVRTAKGLDLPAEPEQRLVDALKTRCLMKVEDDRPDDAWVLLTPNRQRRFVDLDPAALARGEHRLPKAGDQLARVLLIAIPTIIGGALFYLLYWLNGFA